MSEGPDSLPGDPVTVGLRSSDLVAALVNLIINASDAISERQGLVELRTGQQDGGGWIEVSDNGPGIPAEIRNRIFEPFFTTKGKQGTGLGLAMVYSFVRRNRGSIQFDSQVGHGSPFRIWFPPTSLPKAVA